MENKDLIRKSLDIINESMLEDGKEWKRTKAQQDFDHDLDGVPHDPEHDDEDPDADLKHKERKYDSDEEEDFDESVEDGDEDDDDLEASGFPKDPKYYDEKGRYKWMEPEDLDRDEEEDREHDDEEDLEEDDVKEDAPKAKSAPKADSAGTSFPGMGEGIYEGDELDEGINITLDGPEADEFVARLMQLSGQPAPVMPHDAPIQAVPVDVAPVAPDMDGAPAPDMDGPVAQAVDQPEVDADHFVADDSGTCEVCHMPESMCECPMTTQTSGPLLGHDGVTMEEHAEYDHGHCEVDDEGKEVDPETYMYKIPTPAQKMVKGMMGDNPMVEESMERYNRIVNDYVKFLGESDIPNEDGVASPLTAADRQEFDKDPHAGQEPKTDGSMSPMSQIDRQDVMK